MYQYPFFTLAILVDVRNIWGSLTWGLGHSWVGGGGVRACTGQEGGAFFGQSLVWDLSRGIKFLVTFQWVC